MTLRDNQQLEHRLRASINAAIITSPRRRTIILIVAASSSRSPRYNVYLFDTARRLVAALPAYAGLVGVDETTVRVRTAHGATLTLNTNGEIVREAFV
ncbi:MAG TPA: hypothetical protein VKA90_08260, partial [Beijerinckiaceae bacterium]|nr:hypothetical protein [Beijerinckiaceae bacterium]